MWTRSQLLRAQKRERLDVEPPIYVTKREQLLANTLQYQTRLLTHPEPRSKKTRSELFEERRRADFEDIEGTFGPKIAMENSKFQNVVPEKVLPSSYSSSHQPTFRCLSERKEHWKRVYREEGGLAPHPTTTQQPPPLPHPPSTAAPASSGGEREGGSSRPVPHLNLSLLSGGSGGGEREGDPSDAIASRSRHALLDSRKHELRDKAQTHLLAKAKALEVPPERRYSTKDKPFFEYGRAPPNPDAPPRTARARIGGGGGGGGDVQGKVNGRHWKSGLASSFLFVNDRPEEAFRVNHNYYYARDSEFTRTTLEDRGAFDSAVEMTRTLQDRADEREGSIPLFSSFSKDFVFRPPRLPRLDDVQKPKTPMTARGDKSEREKGMPRGDSFHISSARFSSPTLSGDFPSSTSNASSPPASARSRGPVSSTLERVARESASKKVNSDHIDRTLSRGRSLKRSESKLIHDMSDLPEGVQFYPRPPPAQTRASE